MFESLPNHSAIGSMARCCPDVSNKSQEEEEAGMLVKKVLHIYNQLASRINLQPCSEVNKLYSDLVHICTRSVSQQFSNIVLGDARITEILHGLRSICAEIESNVESYWSTKAAGTEGSTRQEIYDRIMEIPHIDVNLNLIRTELKAMRKVQGKAIKKIAIIGSGPLPLTGLGLTGSLFDDPDNNIYTMNIDRDSDAIDVSKVLCRRLGSRAERMGFICAHAGKALELAKYDAVYLAILVGNTQQEKEMLLAEVASKMTPGALIIVRGTTKLKSLMYSVFDPTTESVSKILDVELVVHPENHYIVDSVIIGRVR